VTVPAQHLATWTPPCDHTTFMRVPTLGLLCTVCCWYEATTEKLQ